MNRTLSLLLLFIVFGVTACQNSENVNKVVKEEEQDSLKRDSFKNDVLDTADNFITGGDTSTK